MRATNLVGLLLAGSVSVGVLSPQTAVGQVQTGFQGYQEIRTATGRWMVQKGAVNHDALVVQDVNLEEHVEQAVQQYAAAEGEEARGGARSAVKDKLEQQFALRQEHRMREIVEVEGRVRKLRDTLRKRANDREQIIDRELNDLLSDVDGLGWGEILGGAMRQATLQQQMQRQPMQPQALRQPNKDPLLTLKQQLRDAVQKYGAVEDDNERANARRDIEEVLAQQFALRQDHRMREIVELESQAKRLRETLQKRANAKVQIIDRRLNRLLNEVDDLGWEDADDAAPADRVRREIGRGRLEVERQIEQAAPQNKPAAPGF